MKRNFFLLSFLLITIGCGEKSQGAAPKTTGGGQPFTISGTITNYVQDSIYLMDVYGQTYVPLARAAMGEGGNFYLQGEVPDKGAYYLGYIKDRQLNAVLLFIQDKKKIELTTDAKQMSSMVNFKNSELNTELKAFMAATTDFQQKQARANQEYQQAARTNAPNVETIRIKLDSLYGAQAAYHGKIAERDDLLGTMAKLYHYVPFQSADPQPTQSREQYFLSQFLTSIPLTEDATAHMPMYYQRIRNFVTTLIMQYGYDGPKIKAVIQPYLDKFKEGSRNDELFRLAAIDGSADPNVQRYNPGFTDIYYLLAKDYIAQYPESRFKESIGKNLKQLEAMIRIGSPAPDIVEKGPDGTEYKLSDLRGKIVLLDFWASWCGPCRRENPNVVRMYEKYKDKGFAIFSVSLDKDKSRWTAAIEQDNLKWNTHVSDLGYWNSKHAKAYQVSSIPQMYLIGTDGVIIAKNLRGQALEKKLEELLGDS